MRAVRPPCVIWIVIDSLRRDRVGCYGCARRTTPHIDRFARDCVRLDQMISPHIPTQPAHTTLFTGRDVFSHQIVAQGGTREMDPAIPLLPARLREAGWFTAAVDNIGRWIEPAFERYHRTARWDHDGSKPWRNGEEVTRLALDALREAKSGRRPWLLFLHYWDPHSPYLPPPPFDRMFYHGREKDPANRSMAAVWESPWFANYFREWLEGVTDIEFVKAQYDSSVAYSDHCVGQVLQEVDSEDALVILQSDHGEELDDHGCWFDHHGLYETVVRVPFLMRLPGATYAGASLPALLSFTDVAPTLLELLGLSELSPFGEGLSFAPIPGRESPRERRPGLYLTECTWMRKHAWRTERWKLIEALEPDIYGKPAVELYDLVADPTEERNLAEARPETVEALRIQRDRHIQTRLRETGQPNPILEQADALRTWQPRFIAGKSNA